MGWTVSVIVAVNMVSNLVLLEDGRELAITGYYAACGDHAPLGALTARDELCSCCRVESAEDAEVFVVEFPGVDTALIVEINAIQTAKPSDVN